MWVLRSCGVCGRGSTPGDPERAQGEEAAAAGPGQHPGAWGWLCGKATSAQLQVTRGYHQADFPGATCTLDVLPGVSLQSGSGREAASFSLRGSLSAPDFPFRISAFLDPNLHSEAAPSPGGQCPRKAMYPVLAAGGPFELGLEVVLKPPGCGFCLIKPMLLWRLVTSATAFGLHLGELASPALPGITL